MISRASEISSRSASDLRTRFFPKSRIGHGLISVAPWIDIVVLMMCFVLLDGRISRDPGVQVVMPEGKFMGGMQSGLIAVVRSIDVGADKPRTEIIHFRDDRYLVSELTQMNSLKKDFIELAAKHPGEGVIILSDVNVRNGTLVNIYLMAQEAGIKKVNLATRQSL